MAAISGAVGLKPTLAAAKRGATVALANKECLVCAGAMFMRSAAAVGRQRAAGRFRAQCDLPGAEPRPPRGCAPDRHHRLGRAVPHLDARAMRAATVEQALKHPELVDGPEDHHRLRDHDEQGPRADRGAPSVRRRRRRSSRCWCIRSRSCTAWSSSATARWWRSSARPTCASRSPIASPGRPGSTGRPRGSILPRSATLTFEAPDPERFPALALGRRALETGGAAPTVLNAANEVAVAAFVDRRLGFGGIAALVEATLDAAERRNATAEPQDIDEALAVDHMARSLAHDLLPEIAAKSS